MRNELGGYPLYAVPPGVETRWASPENPGAAKSGGGTSNGGRKGAPCFPLAPGECKVLAEQASGSGTIRRIWSTLSDRSPEMLRALRLDFYWDGCDVPAVSAPFGDFFGIAGGRTAAFESDLFSSPEGRSFNCFVPMPYRRGMKMTVTNGGDKALNMFFYDIDFTVGDAHGDNVLYFHAHFGHQPATALRQDYEILPRVSGTGRFLGANVGVKADRERYFDVWWGEGEFKLYVDGDDAWPTLCGTGTEDYIGTAWELGTYHHRFQGCTFADHERMEFCFYRYHVPDPVYFHRDIRVTAQQMGTASPEQRERFRQAGTVLLCAGPDERYFDYEDEAKARQWENFERSDDWRSCAYFYLNRPEHG
ncbi:DUF2961 domain-containing protein [Paenibacillus sp. MWE-103]|uniref:DUF2961 domain-containing protein n=1 Tax=Paenibacillus artemisiicola TaxID=1172618 RepID=A0ABS3W3X0_9BACL|nr:glycoside hydrolase family 172 protein [Paenibacillus artemisiicola]MBO7742997.1 DUF2961 domain-containing protein [Paenibacillus artemisiicola]